MKGTITRHNVSDLALSTLPSQSVFEAPSEESQLAFRRHDPVAKIGVDETEQSHGNGLPIEGLKHLGLCYARGSAIPPLFGRKPEDISAFNRTVVACYHKNHDCYHYLSI